MVKQGKRVLSMTAVYKTLPSGVFHPMLKIPYQQCLCDTCLNMELVMAGALNAGVKGLSRSLT
jgi:hypothetical protein